MLSLGLGIIFFLVLSIATGAFAGILLAVDCHCIDTGRLMEFALMFGVASNLCFFGGFLTPQSPAD